MDSLIKPVYVCKPFANGKVNVWNFKRLNPKLWGAKSIFGKTLYFTKESRAVTCLNDFVTKYGYRTLDDKQVVQSNLQTIITKAKPKY